MKNLRKFANEAEYSAATLNYPAVSWVTATDGVHFDKSAPAPVVISQEVNSPDEETFRFYNCGSSTPLASIDSITLNDEAVSTATCSTNLNSPSGVYTAEYMLKGTTIGEEFSGNLAFGGSSDAEPIEMLIPSNVTSVQYLPQNLVGGTLIINRRTPPTVVCALSGTVCHMMFVPDEAINAYSNWVDFVEMSVIYPLSEYEGNLPV